MIRQIVILIALTVAICTGLVLVLDPPRCPHNGPDAEIGTVLKLAGC